MPRKYSMGRLPGHSGIIWSETIEYFLINTQQRRLDIAVDFKDENGNMVGDNVVFDFDKTKLGLTLNRFAENLNNIVKANPVGYEITAVDSEGALKEALYWILSDSTGSSRTDPIE